MEASFRQRGSRSGRACVFSRDRMSDPWVLVLQSRDVPALLQDSSQAKSSLFRCFSSVARTPLQAGFVVIGCLLYVLGTHALPP